LAIARPHASPLLVSPGGKVVCAPPGSVDRDSWQEIEFYSQDLAEHRFPAHEDVALAAYYRYLTRGGLDGHALEDWFAAEQDLLWEQMGIEPFERPQ
jgi:hypothetical protein